MNDKVKAITLMAGILLMSTGCSSNEDPAPASSSGGGNPAATISKAADTTTIVAGVSMADDLRGLTYARAGGNSGKIYASGHVGSAAATRQAVVARFNADGLPDNTFGTGGFVQLEATTTQGAPGNDETSLGIAELLGGDVVVAVNAIDAGGQSVYLFRLTSTGAKVNGWGNQNAGTGIGIGAVEVVFGGAAAASDTAWDVQVDRSVGFDRIVVFGLGTAPNGSGRTDSDRYVVRLLVTPTGADPDLNFNTTGVYTFHSTGTEPDNQRRGIVESDGKIVSAGYTGFSSTPGVGNTVILFRLTNLGTLDPSFGGFSSEPALVANTPGVAVFNPFKVNGGVAECYAVGRQSTGSYVTTGYGGATGAGMGSTLGYFTTQAPDLVSFRVSGGIGTGLDATWAPDREGKLAIQSESPVGQAPFEERGRHMVVLADDRVIEVGRYNGKPAYYVLSANGDQRSPVELPHATVNSQFFGAALSPDGKNVAMTTNADTTAAPAGGARLVILNVN